MNICNLKNYLIFIVVLVCSHAHSESVSRWPKVKELNATYQFSTEKSSGFDIPITGADGRQLYELKCHPADYEGDADFDYSGAIDCRFISTYSKEKVSTLFAENEKQNSDWENRGRFLVEHLLPGCAAYPEWGAVRAFQLRGMKVILSIKNIQFFDQEKAPKLSAFNLNVAVKNSTNIQSALALPVDIKEPYWFYHPSIDACRNKK